MNLTESRKLIDGLEPTEEIDDLPSYIEAANSLMEAVLKEDTILEITPQEVAEHLQKVVEGPITPRLVWRSMLLAIAEVNSGSLASLLGRAARHIDHDPEVLKKFLARTVYPAISELKQKDHVFERHEFGDWCWEDPTLEELRKEAEND